MPYNVPFDFLNALCYLSFLNLFHSVCKMYWKDTQLGNIVSNPYKYSVNDS